MKIMCVLALMLLTTAKVFSQSITCDDDRMPWEANATFGLNTDGYQVDLGIAYYPFQYIGTKVQLGSASEIKELGDWGKDDLETGHSYATRLKLLFSLPIRSPKIIDWKNQEGGFYLFFEPGMLLSPGASGSHQADWLNWDLRTGINFQIYRFIFYIGYGVSDFSLYSGYPHNHWGTASHDKYITQSGFIGGAYKF